MIRFTAILCAVLAGLVLAAPGASARGWHRYPGSDGWRHHSAGGPLRIGNRCWVSTDDKGYGFYRWCPGAPHKKVRHHRRYYRR